MPLGALEVKFYESLKDMNDLTFVESSVVKRYFLVQSTYNRS